MKISAYDKLQAIKRSKEYRKDYLKYTGERDRAGDNDLFMYGVQTGERAFELSESGKRLCKQWLIRFPVNPDAEYVKGEEACVHSPVTYLDIPEQWIKTVYRSGKNGRKENITHINGKLVLMIDTGYSSDQIKSEFDKILSFWTRKTKERAKPSKRVDIWCVYDEVKSGHKIYQVAKKYANKITTPGLPIILTEAEIKLIQDSYKKAKKIVSAIEKRKQTLVSIDPMEDSSTNSAKNK